MRLKAIWMLLPAALLACSEGEEAAGRDEATRPAAETEVAATEPATIDPETGPELYDHWCGPCHDPGIGRPGTQGLEILRGAENSILRERDDLTADYVKLVVRQGLLMMPPFRPTEITDAELDRLAQFLAGDGTASGSVQDTTAESE